MYFGNAKKLEPEILSWPLHSYMNHPKRNEKCRQLLFLSRYHNEHVSVETETPKIHATCTSLFMTKKSKSQTYAQSNSASERFKAAAFCKENYPIPSCPQLRRRHGCSSTINSLLYGSTCMFFFFLWFPSLSLKENSGCSSRSQDTNNAKQHLLFKSSSSQNTLEEVSLGQIIASTYHIACTDTGLNI